MNPLPFERCYIISPLTPGEAEARIGEDIKRSVYGFKAIFSKPSGAYFTGKIANGVFKVIPTTSGTNSFLPCIKGTITPCPDGSQIYVRFNMHIIIIIVFMAMLVFISHATMLSINKHISLGQSTDDDYLSLAILPAIMLFGMWEFKRQCLRAKERLMEITDGDLRR